MQVVGCKNKIQRITLAAFTLNALYQARREFAFICIATAENRKMIPQVYLS